MPRPVSIIVWRDAKTDPPKGPLRFVIVESASGAVSPIWFRDHVWDYPNIVRWAELPVLSDLTDNDVRQIDIILHALDAQAVYLGDPATRQPDLSEKFHAAAYGTQEDT